MSTKKEPSGLEGSVRSFGPSLSILNLNQPTIRIGEEVGFRRARVSTVLRFKFLLILVMIIAPVGLHVNRNLRCFCHLVLPP
jgi:hypothetical protein